MNKTEITYSKGKLEDIETSANALIDYVMDFAPENARWLNVLNEIRSDVDERSAQ
jgi:hypothetical protein